MNLHLKSRLVLFSIICLCYTSVFADCWADFKTQTDQQTASLETRYKKIDSNFKSILPINRPFTLEGPKDELMIIIHGFLGSPDEMRSVADVAQKTGLKVYSALIPGFGGTADIANQYKNKQWIKWTNSEIKRAEACFSHVHVMGFSTGATLLHDYVTRNPDDLQLSSIVLISPFFKTHTLFNAAVKTLSLTFLNKLSLKLLYPLLPVSDLGAIIAKPDSYLQTVPLDNMQEVISLGEDNKHRKIKEQSLKVRILGLVSRQDFVADHDDSEALLKHNFANLNLNIYAGIPHVPHQLMSYSVNPLAAEVHSDIYNFLK